MNCLYCYLLVRLPGKKEVCPALYKNVRRQKYIVGTETQHQNRNKPASIFGSRLRFFWTAYFTECQAAGMTATNELGKDIRSTGHDLYL